MAVSEIAPPPVPALPIRINVLLVLTVLTAVYCVATIFPGTLWLTVPLGLLTLLFTPGYGLVAIGVGEQARWPWYLTTIVVVGLSVAFNVAIGLLLVHGDYGLLPLVLAISSLFVLFLGGVAQFVRADHTSDSRFVAMIRSELGLGGFTSAQRTAAYALLLAIILVLGGLTYIASVNPREKSDVSLGITGPDGSSNTLPIGFPNMAPTTLVITIGNDNSAQAWTLRISTNATLAGNPGVNGTVPPPFVPPPVANRSVPWSSPLYLGDGVESETALGMLTSNEVITLNVTVQFNATVTNETRSFTDYTLTFQLVPATGGSPARVATWYFEIKVPPPASGPTLSPEGRTWG